MPIELKVPPVGESITEVIIGDWLKAVGEWVAEDEPVVVVESDKVNMEVPAPAAGVLTEQRLSTGDTANIGDVVGLMEAKAKPEGDAASDGESDSGDDSAQSAPTAQAAPSGGETRVTPAARRALATNNLQVGDVSPTGPGGRLLKEDVLRHVAAQGSPAPKPAAPPAAKGPSGPRATETVRMSSLRRTVARRLVEAQQTAALLTTFNEIDMSAVKALRAQYKQAFIDRYGIKLGFMSFFVKAVCDALQAFPALNAQIDGDNIVYHNYCDIGIAVGGGKGLVVPVIRNAESLGFAEVEQTINDLGTRARDNKLKLDELMGGTFSITNGGIYGSLLSTPIINPPQSGILGMHGIQDRPVALNGEVVIRPMMYVALTYDHRIVDGKGAVSFLKRVKELIEDPVRLVLEV